MCIQDGDTRLFPVWPFKEYAEKFVSSMSNGHKYNCSKLNLETRVRDKNFMFFNQAKDIEYWAAFQGRLIYLYSLVLIPEDKLPV